MCPVSKSAVRTVQLESMLSMAQSASKLLEEVKVLRDSVSEGKQLRSEMHTLSSRAAEDAAATRRLQQELAQSISDLTAAQDQLQVYRTELQRVQQQVGPDRPIASLMFLVCMHVTASVHLMTKPNSLIVRFTLSDVGPCSSLSCRRRRTECGLTLR